MNHFMLMFQMCLYATLMALKANLLPGIWLSATAFYEFKVISVIEAEESIQYRTLKYHLDQPQK